MQYTSTQHKIVLEFKSAVILCIFLCICSVTDILAVVPQIGVNVSLHDGRSIIRTESLPFWC